MQGISTVSDEKGNYSKVEREIMEILDDIETKQPPPRPSNVVEFRRPSRRKLPRLSLPSFDELRYAMSPGKLMLVMLAAVIGAVFLQGVPFLSPILIVVAIVAFAGVFFARSKPSGPGGKYNAKQPGIKRWRGRDIDLSNRG